MTKMLDLARLPGACGGSCPNGVTRPLTAVPGSAGFGAGTRDAAGDATSRRNGAPLVKVFEAGVLKTLGLYRELVGIEIGRASEYGARWWSRRLVEVYEEAGLVGLAK